MLTVIWDSPISERYTGHRLNLWSEWPTVNCSAVSGRDVVAWCFSQVHCGGVVYSGFLGLAELCNNLHMYMRAHVRSCTCTHTHTQTPPLRNSWLLLYLQVTFHSSVCCQCSLQIQIFVHPLTCSTYNYFSQAFMMVSYLKLLLFAAIDTFLFLQLVQF
jgi:hypothetical protein